MNDILTTEKQIEPENEEFEYAGFWVRLWAYIIDSFLLYVIIFPIMVWFYGTNYYLSELFILGVMDVLFSYLFPILTVVLFWVYYQATPGKIAIHAKILDAKTGKHPTTQQYIIRYLSYFLSALAFGIGFFYIAFDPKKQGWHDKLAGTVVIKRKNVRPEKVRFKD